MNTKKIQLVGTSLTPALHFADDGVVYCNGNGSPAGGDVSATLKSEASGNYILLTDASNQKLKGLKIYGETWYADTEKYRFPEPNESRILASYGESGSISVSLCGKNLINSSIDLGSDWGSSYTTNGITFTRWSPGKIQVKGIATADAVCNLCKMNLTIVDRELVFDTVLSEYNESIAVLSGGTDDVQLRYNKNDGIISLFVAVGSDVNTTVWPQAELNSVDTAYEQYVDLGSVTIPTPNGLCGVCWNDSYVQDDQHWIRDEIDFDKGVYIQRVKKLVFDGTEQWMIANNAAQLEVADMVIKGSLNDGDIINGLFCSHFYEHGYDVGDTDGDTMGIASGTNYLFFQTKGYYDNTEKAWVNYTDNVERWTAFIKSKYEAGTPVTVYYPLATPIETPLSSDVLTVYAAMTTNYPKTSILNDAMAPMEVSYVADIQARIDSSMVALNPALDQDIINHIDPDFDKNSFAVIAYVSKYMDPSKYWKVGDYKMVDIPGYDTPIPLTIIGFNHDNVTNSYAYGKTKAGMTLQLGAPRTIYGDTKSSLYHPYIDGLMDADGRFKSPNKVGLNFTEVASHWENCGMRAALQNLFDNTEFGPYMVEVDKLTSMYWNASIAYPAYIETSDKVFLPSEYEMFGAVFNAPCKEGEHYELFQKGGSKFYWADEYFDGVRPNAGTWLRSAVQVNVWDSTKSAPKGDSMATCRIYQTVYSVDPPSVSYGPSYAGGAGGYITPCICI